MSFYGCAFASVLIRCARQYIEEGEIGMACRSYLSAFSIDPGCKDAYRKEFLLLFTEWCNQLEKRKKYDILFKFYKEALTIFPNDLYILNNFGSHLLKYGLLREAAFYFRECLSIDPDFIRAAHNLDDVFILQVERWHFKMLNDQIRNEAFQEAITKKIRQGFNRVLDVGTGTGLLSLFCLAGNAKEIYACDASRAMIEIASKVFLFNGGNNIKLIEKHSSDLQIPEDIEKRVSLLVTETFDVGLLGEHVLPTLTHAWKHLLLPPHPRSEILDPVKFGVVVPYKAVMYVTGTQFDKLANDFHLKRTNNLNQYLFGDWNVLQSCDHYDSQDLSRAQCKFLTDTKKMFEINFNNPDALVEFLKGWHKNMTLKCKSYGRLDCFAVWFDLYLDEDIVLSTSPVTKASSAWDQAVFLLPRSMIVKEEQDIKITVSFDTSKLNIALSDNCSDNPNFVASEDVIKMLNNEKLAEKFLQVVNNVTPAYADSVSVLDCYPFPVFGLNFLRNRSDRFHDELTCFVPTENDQKLVNCMAEKYGVKVDTGVKTKTDFEDYISDKKFDIILLDLVEMTGEIKDEILLLLDFFKSLLKPGGIILPERVTVIGQFIYSDWLATVSSVSNNSVTCGYKIAEYINEYQVQRFVDFDPKCIDSIACSEPFELFHFFKSFESPTSMKVPRQSSAEFVNAMVYWLKIRFMENSDDFLTVDNIFYHQAAILFPKMKLHDTIKFVIIRNNGLFTVHLLSKPFDLYDKLIP